jgi:hypothetical protein
MAEPLLGAGRALEVRARGWPKAGKTRLLEAEGMASLDAIMYFLGEDWTIDGGYV